MKRLRIVLLLSILCAVTLGGASSPDCPVLTFEGVSEDTWSCIKTKFTEKGFTVARGVSGEIANADVRGEFDYQVAQKKLTITVKTQAVYSTANRAITEAVDASKDFQEVRLLHRGSIERWRIDAPNVQQAETKYEQDQVQTW